MKKYILGLIVIVLMITSSAFIIIKSNEKAPPAVYHWYFVDASGAVVPGSEAFNGATETQAYANSNPPCPTGTKSDCIRGFINVPTLPTMAKGEATPLKKP